MIHGHTVVFDESWPYFGGVVGSGLGFWFDICVHNITDAVLAQLEAYL